MAAGLLGILQAWKDLQAQQQKVPERAKRMKHIASGMMVLSRLSGIDEKSEWRAAIAGRPPEARPDALSATEVLALLPRLVFVDDLVITTTRDLQARLTVNLPAKSFEQGGALATRHRRLTKMLTSSW